jgi:hypothetical protein
VAHQSLLVRVLSVCCAILAVMSRHTAFRFCLDPTVEQQKVLAGMQERPGSHTTSAYGS